MLSEVFFSFFITSLVGFLIVIARMLYKSKCTEFSFCGLKILRNVELEAEIDEEMMENGINPVDSSKELNSKPTRIKHHRRLSKEFVKQSNDEDESKDDPL